ncbi:MAG: VOC family protein [Betaproteobacteria bacterium]|nr:VOC family protein [Betaproteobacteria bacterium]
MSGLAELSLQGVGKAASSVIAPVTIERGTYVTRDLTITRHFLEGALGMQCVRVTPDRLIARHRTGQTGYWVLEVQLVAAIEHPQSVVNHWGLFVSSHAEVDRAFALLTARHAEFRIKRVQKTRNNHASYSFYFEDLDTNWWEIEHPFTASPYADEVAPGDTYGLPPVDKKATP